MNTINLRKTSAFALAALLLGGCERVKDFTRETGLVSRPAPAAEQIEIIVDSGAGSTGTPETLRATLDVVLPYAAHRPGSIVRVWRVGEDPTDSEPIAVRTVTKPIRSGVRAKRSHQKKFVEESQLFFTTAARPLFEERTRRQTPLFETLTRVALTSTSLPRRIILIGDLREETSRTARTECDELPEAAALLDRLHERGILTPGLLKGTTVHLAFVNFGRVENDRCISDIGNFAQLQNLWRDVLDASAATVHITSEAPDLEQ